MPSTEFGETAVIVPLITPVNLGTGANNGDWVDMAGYESATFVVFKGIGTAGDDPIIKLQQATTSGGTPKDLLFTRVRSKVGVTGGSFLLGAVSDYTLNTQSAATSYVDAVSAEAESIFQIDIKASDLDVQNGYHWVQLSMADVGGTQLGCAFAIMRNGRYFASTMPSPISTTS